jgi:fermentation-respiration switch protein FrsA (DUF1100 family)
MKRYGGIGDQCTREARGEPVRVISFVPASPEEIARDTPRMYREGYEYYCTPRAQHPNAPGKYVFSSVGLQMGFFPFEQVETISPRPLLMIAGSEADSLYFSEEAIAKAKDPKELFIIPGASHIDLYDKPQYVPQVESKLTDFFSKNL